MSFAHARSHPLPHLGLTIELYEHPTGAVHLHLASADQHRAFVVGCRTEPPDSSGLPHILEHLALCGSRRYPVRDPFFNMLRRSLQTFMNAFTYPDMTAYPFATQVTKDFDNLLGVYLDAVFAPTLDRLDFAQEGWRLAPASWPLPAGADAQNCDWAFKGVVFNEMKGGMADSDSLMFQAVTEALLPETGYRFNSGGDPLQIPRLAYDDLVAFHQDRYGAANSCFVSYGDGDVAALQKRFAPYLAAAPGRAIPPVALQGPITPPSPLRVPVPLAAGQDPRDVAVVGWHYAWGDSSCLDDVLLGELTDRLLFGHPAAPLRLALDSSGLGRSCGGSGFMAYLRNGLFSIELDGIAPADYPRFEALVQEELQALAERGFPTDEVDAALHQVELARRRIGGDGMPFGLQLCLRGLMAWNHGRDPVDALDQDAAIARLAERVRQPGFWPATLRQRFLEQPHRLLAMAEPDAGFQERQDRAEAELVQERLAPCHRILVVAEGGEARTGCRRSR